MNPYAASKPYGFSGLISAVAIFVLFVIGTAPALAQSTPALTLAKTPDAGSVAPGGTATFTIVLSNSSGAIARAVSLIDILPAAVINWDIVSRTPGFDCSIALEGSDQVLRCTPPSEDVPNGAAFTVVVSGTAPTACGLSLENTATAFFSENQTPVSDSGDIVVQCGRPLFVIGDREPHAALDSVNFWGSQWWKNNKLSGFVAKGVASFKGYASDSDADCGGEWESRVGNSPPPPDTIPDVIKVIVTDTVDKNGPNIGGRIVQIVEVRVDPGYGPAPGHRGNGTVIRALCTLDE